jgi:glycosyltransferase involved in cell wall biosynthesis
VRDVAVAMARCGHEVAAYSPLLGGVADEMRRSDVFVADNLAQIPWRPDIIHGHHHLEFMAALLFYRGVPAVFISHGWVPWVEIPPRHPRIMQYFAVDNPTRDAAIKNHGVPAEQIRVLPNFVDLERFKPRSPLPVKPGRALVLSNNAHEGTHLPFIRKACAAVGIEVQVCGQKAGKVAERPEDILPEHDIVFAKGRSALEAVAVGNAVIICDSFGVGPMVSPRNALQLRTLNGDYRSLCEPLSTDAISRALTKYNPSEAAAVSQLARTMIGLDKAVGAIIRAYEEAIAQLASRPENAEAEAAAESAYLAWLSRYIKEKRSYDTSLVEHMRQRFGGVPALRHLIPLMNVIHRRVKSARITAN